MSDSNGVSHLIQLSPPKPVSNFHSGIFKKIRQIYHNSFNNTVLLGFFPLNYVYRQHYCDLILVCILGPFNGKTRGERT